jgi:hypothetical protein
MSALPNLLGLKPKGHSLFNFASAEARMILNSVPLAEASGKSIHNIVKSQSNRNTLDLFGTER